MTSNRRILVVGVSGSGKTTLARQISERLDVPHIEMDALRWEAEWTVSAEFTQRLDHATAQPNWVMDGNSTKQRDLTWPRADTIIWLDYPFPLVFYRVFVRTMRRILAREKLWAGNVETFRAQFATRDSILLWVIQVYGKRKRFFRKMMTGNDFPNLHWIRLTSPREVTTLLEQLKTHP